jgi:hypothetical protein
MCKTEALYNHVYLDLDLDLDLKGWVGGGNVSSKTKLAMTKRHSLKINRIALRDVV